MDVVVDSEIKWKSHDSLAVVVLFCVQILLCHDYGMWQLILSNLTIFEENINEYKQQQKHMKVKLINV